MSSMRAMNDAPLRGPDPSEVRSRLVNWYERCRRDLPWRATRDPYAVLVSEVMLQQTRVETALPYYLRFLQRFPSASHLAAATEAEVLAVWQGLGYYRRARHLWQAARVMVERYGGRVPADPEALRALPGVGEYTAGAVLSIAFGLPVPAVDGNAERVLARIFGVDEPVDRAPGRRRVRRLAEALVDGPRPGDVNQAIMELGATVCTPRQPACPRCPVAGLCQARASGDPGRWPVRSRRARVEEQAFVLAWCLAGDRLALVRRPPQGLLAGLWALPYAERRPGESWLDARQRLAAVLEAAVGGPVRWLGPVFSGRWEFSHRRWHLRAYAAEPAGPAGGGSLVRETGPGPWAGAARAAGCEEEPAVQGQPPAVQWVPLDALDRLAMASLDRRVIEQIRAAARAG